MSRFWLATGYHAFQPLFWILKPAGASPSQSREFEKRGDLKNLAPQMSLLYAAYAILAIVDSVSVMTCANRICQHLSVNVVQFPFDSLSAWTFHVTGMNM